MRKALSVVLTFVVLLISVSAMASNIDLSSMSEQELQELINAASEELASRNTQSSSDIASDAAVKAEHISVTINPSPDKYTWFIKDYVGKNLASIGYTSLGGDRYDSYGDGLLELVFVTDDGIYIDPEDDDQLKKYIVTEQNIEPNSEMKLVFSKYSDGTESSSTESQSFEEIELRVKKVNDDSIVGTVVPELTVVNPSPNKYIWFIKDYIGRNVASFGYTSLGGDRYDRYGDSLLELIFVADDGSYIDPEDADQLKEYIVTKQNIKPNSEMKLVFSKYSDGTESSSTESQSYEEIELYVKRINLVTYDTDVDTSPDAAISSTDVDHTQNTLGAESNTADVANITNAKVTYMPGDFSFSILEDDTAEITDYYGNAKELQIPDTLDGKTVTSIGARAFEYCGSLVSITLPDSVISIGEMAFFGCTSLAGITIQGRELSIGDGAFSSCSSLANFTIQGSVASIGVRAFEYCGSLASITLPDSVTSIGEMAFFGCTSLTDVTIQGRETSIGDGAFSSCNSLTNFTIQGGVASIGVRAFEYCGSLASITLPESVTSISEMAFFSCTSLLDVTIQGRETSIGDGAFSSCSSLTNFTIQGSVASIGVRAFEYCGSLLSIKLPNSVTSIGEMAFFGCTRLTDVIIQGRETSIGDGAFSSCSSLANFTIQGSVASIGVRAFEYCGSLASITLPDSITSIGEMAFLGCSYSLTLTVGRDSYAMQYAIDNGLSYTYADASTV